MKTRYAIKIMLAVDDWIYVTEGCKEDLFNIQPLLFPSRDSAEKSAKNTGWKMYKIVRYRGETK